MWDQLLAAINAKDSKLAQEVIEKMSVEELKRDSSKLPYNHHCRGGDSDICTDLDTNPDVTPEIPVPPLRKVVTGPNKRVDGVVKVVEYNPGHHRTSCNVSLAEVPY